MKEEVPGEKMNVFGLSGPGGRGTATDNYQERADRKRVSLPCP